MRPARWDMSSVTDPCPKLCWLGETILDMAKSAEQTNEEMLWERHAEKIKCLSKSQLCRDAGKTPGNECLVRGGILGLVLQWSWKSFLSVLCVISLNKWECPNWARCGIRCTSVFYSDLLAVFCFPGHCSGKSQVCLDLSRLCSCLPVFQSSSFSFSRENVCYWNNLFNPSCEKDSRCKEIAIAEPSIQIVLLFFQM